MDRKHKIILTGANGQLAKTICLNLKKKYNLITYSKKQIDISNKKDLLKLDTKDCKILINTAAYTNVEKAEKYKKKAHLVNYKSLKNLKKICEKNKIFFIHFSTDYVFNGNTKTPYKENSKTNPVNQYGKSKAKGETFLLKSINKNFLIIRLSWVYSKYALNFYSKIKKLIKENNIIKVVDDQFGIPTSTDFISENLDLIIIKIICKERLSNIYHLTPNGKTTWYKFSKIIKKYTLKKHNWNVKNTKIIPTKSYFKNKAKRPLYSVLNSDKIQKKLNIEFKNWDYYFKKGV